MFKLKNNILPNNSYTLYVFYTIEDLRSVKDALFYHWKWIIRWCETAFDVSAFHVFDTEQIILLHLSPELLLINDEEVYISQICQLHAVGPKIIEILKDRQIYTLNIIHTQGAHRVYNTVLEGFAIANCHTYFTLKDIIVLKNQVTRTWIQYLNALYHGLIWSFQQKQHAHKTTGLLPFITDIQKMAKELSLRCQIVKEDKLRQWGFLEWYTGDTNMTASPQMLVVEYNPPHAISQYPMVLLGAGVGVECYKNKSNTQEMDSSTLLFPATQVMTLMKIVATLDLPIKLVALAPLLELKSWDATLTTDKLYSYNNHWKISTHKELDKWWLMMADTLRYAQRLSPQLIIHYTTWLNSHLIPYQQKGSIVYSRIKAAIKNVIEKAGQRTQDKLLFLPDWSDFEEDIVRGNDQILLNSENSVSIHEFLKKMTTSSIMTMDISSLTYNNSNQHDRSYLKGVRWLIELLMRQSKKAIE